MESFTHEENQLIARIVKYCSSYPSDSFESWLNDIQKALGVNIKLSPRLTVHLVYIYLHQHEGILITNMEMYSR